jgi:fumarate reductase flavoprotein subunit
MGNSKLSRRSFLQGVGLAGVGALSVGALSACSPKDARSETAVQEAADADWLGAPELIEESAIKETRSCDVLVIGAGLSGLCAATSAAQAGAKVIVIEKNKTSRYGGIFHSAIGYKDQIDAGVSLDPEEVLNDELMKNGPLCDSAHWTNWAYKSGEIMDWLLDIVKAKGVVTFLPFTEYPAGPDFSKEAYITVPGSFVTGWDHFLDEGHEATKWELEALRDAASTAGAEFIYNTAGKYLEQDDLGVVTGAVAQDVEGNYLRIEAAKGVVVSTGDFAGNLEMCKALLPESIAEDMYNHASYTMYMYSEDLPEGSDRLDSGDGHKMMIWAGATMEDSPVSTMGWPNVAEMGLIPYLGVNSAGRRFCNEANAFMMIGRMAYDQPCAKEKGTHFWKIVDADYQQQTADMLPICMFGAMGAGLDEEVMAAAPNVKASSIEELAAGMDVDAEVLKAQIDRYNELAENGTDTDFAKPGHYLFPIKEAPFYAVRASQTFVHTMSGVLCSADLEVMGADGPILGLYATGNTVGRRFGSHYEASLPGASNAFAVVHGYMAGKNAASR